MLAAFPLLYFLFSAAALGRPSIYYIQLFVMIGFIILELVLDYILKVEFRQVRWTAIAYVMFFFAGTGGMIGIASLAGKPWSVISIVLFLIMAALAFYQQAKTGM